MSVNDSFPRAVHGSIATLLGLVVGGLSAFAQTSDPPAPPAAAKNLVIDVRGRRLAIVVGLDQEGLRLAEKDARDVTVALRAAGWTVKPLVLTESDGRPTEKEDWPQDPKSIVTVIETISRKARKEDTLLFYYSGHGHEFEGEIYLSTMALDKSSMETLTQTGLALGRVQRAMTLGECQKAIVILDACRKDPSQKFVPTTGFTPQAMARTIGMGVLYSTAPGAVSFEPRSGQRDSDGFPIDNGLFTHFLLRGLAGEARLNADEFLTFGELSMYVGEAMTRYTIENIEYAAQEPRMLWNGTPQGDLFIRQLASVPAARVPDPKEFTAILEAGVDAATGYAKAIRHNASGILLRLIPKGTFRMGSPEAETEGFKDEQPQHSVEVTKPFYLGETEVTIGQWRAYAKATGAKTEAEQSDGGFTLIGTGSDLKWEKRPGAIWTNPLPEQGFRPSDDHPVTQVSWNDAVQFCQHYGFVLPTEAEWEYACRAGSTARYFWGDSESAGLGMLNGADQAAKAKWNPTWSIFSFDDRFPFTAPVGSFNPNGFGLRDTLGNVWEWCRDGYDAEAYSKRGAGVTRDPFIAPAPAGRVVLRGGSWGSEPINARAAFRSYDAPEYRYDFVGFRVARTF